MQAPSFRALYTLRVDDARRRADLAPHRFATFDAQSMVDAIERPIIVPKVKIFEQRAAWRQVLGHGTPLAAGAQDVHQAVDDFTDINAPLTPAMLGRWYQWRNRAHSSSVTSLG